MPDNICVGDVVQINPDYDTRFGGCFMVVTELKPSWNGLMGYVTVPGDGGQAFCRIKTEHVVRIGKAEWAIK